MDTLRHLHKGAALLSDERLHKAIQKYENHRFIVNARRVIRTAVRNRRVGLISQNPDGSKVALLKPEEYDTRQFSKHFSKYYSVVLLASKAKHSKSILLLLSYISGHLERDRVDINFTVTDVCAYYGINDRHGMTCAVRFLKEKDVIDNVKLMKKSGRSVTYKHRFIINPLVFFNGNYKCFMDLPTQQQGTRKAKRIKKTQLNVAEK